MTDEQQALVLSSTRLAGWIAKKFRIPGLDYQDVVQIAMVGLCKAAIRNKEGTGASFSTWAVMHMRKEILRERAHARYKLTTQPIDVTPQYRMATTENYDEQPQLDFIAQKLASLELCNVEIIISRLRGETWTSIWQGMGVTEWELRKRMKEIRSVIEAAQ